MTDEQYKEIINALNYLSKRIEALERSQPINITPTIFPQACWHDWEPYTGGERCKKCGETRIATIH